MNGDFASKLQGAQNEYIYFGKNSGAAVKWRVLSKSGSDYGSGMLLWADKQITIETYNSCYQNPDYAFWGTSKIRASLNGGFYYGAVSSPTVAPSESNKLSIQLENSWYYNLFTADEKGSIEAARSYSTDDWGIDLSLSQYQFKKMGITVSATASNTTNTVNGKYNINRLNAPTAQHASYDTTNGTVQETTNGDKLFLLDYYDINNVNYGFGDNGVVYANKVDSSWTPASNNYPGYYDGTGKNFNNITSDYLKFSGEAADYYWLRPAGRYNVSNSFALVTNSIGCIGRANVAESLIGVRPAFNLDPSTVVYATAASLDTVNSTLSSVNTAASTTDGKPAYKLYIKNGSYAAYNSTAKAKVAINDKTLNVAYNNPTVTTAGSGVTSGKLVLLLSKNGVVEYQAEQPMNGAATNAGTTTTTFTLPVGLNYKDYTANLLFTSANGGVASETVYCSYNLANSSVDIPADVNMTYDGTSKWVGDLQGTDVPDWYDKEVHGSTSFVKLDSILYTDNDGDYTDEPVEANAVKAAGKYKVTLVLADNLKWSSGDATDNKRTFNINIAKAAPKVNVAIDGDVPHYVPSELPTIKLDETKENTPGTVKWKTVADNKPKAGANNYTWAFTPTDTNNYLTKDDGKMLLTFYAPEIAKVEITDFNPENKAIFTTTTLGEFTKLFKVKVSYKDDAKAAEENYKDFTVVVNNKTIDPTSTASFLKVGTNTLKVRVKDAAKNNAIIESLSITINDVKELGFEELNSIALDTAEFVYPVTAQQILDDIVEISVKLNDGTSDFANKSDDAEKFASFLAKLEVVEDASTLKVGDSVSVTFRIKGLETEVAKFGETIKITKGTYNIPDSVFEDKIVTYTGEAIELDGWINLNDLPKGMTVTYTCDTDMIEVGDYTVTATFSNPDPDNYNDPDPKTATLTISDKKQYKKDNLSFTVSGGATGENGAYTATYDPAKTISFVLDGKLLDKDGNEVDESTVSVTRDYKYQKKIDGVWTDVTAEEMKGAGDYRVTVTISTDDEAYDDVKMTAELTVAKADADVKGAEVKPAGANSGLTADGNGGYKGTYKPDGKFELDIDKSNLPDNVTPKEPVYKKLVDGKWETVSEIKEAGTYKVVVELEPTDPDNYNAIAPLEVSVTINAAEVESVSAAVEDGAKFDINNTLDDVIAKIKAEVSYNNGTKEDVEVGKLTITCATLREGGLLDVGKQIITVKYSDGVETTVEINVGKAKVALPVYSGTLSYNGNELKPTAADFTGFDGSLMAFVESKTDAGTNAGTYKAVFALTDTDRYEWATAKTFKKSVFAVALYDLEPGEAEVEWTLARAVITATKGADGKPIL
ncbi:MAG: hypothetical protein K2G26_03655, partial [Clostridia bacterium]|nr:hypothetical protein [Clostridia bacterium]